MVEPNLSVSSLLADHQAGYAEFVLATLKQFTENGRVDFVRLALSRPTLYRNLVTITLSVAECGEGSGLVVVGPDGFLIGGMLLDRYLVTTVKTKGNFGWHVTKPKPYDPKCCLIVNYLDELAEFPGIRSTLEAEGIEVQRIAAIVNSCPGALVEVEGPLRTVKQLYGVPVVSVYETVNTEE